MANTPALVAAAGTIPLPIDQSGSTTSPTPLFALRQTGTGPNGQFSISNSGNNNTALTAQTNGPGIGLIASTSGAGLAGVFFKTGGMGSNAALFASNAGPGPALQARGIGSGSAAKFEIPGTFTGAPAVDISTRGGGVAAVFHRDPGSAQGVVVLAINNIAGAAVAELDLLNSISHAPVLISRTTGIGWAGDFFGTQKGLRVTTNAGGTGLQVVNGTKNAVVGTATGARALYTEESSEVWFTDYGFGRLRNGRARILFEPTFAQTVSADAPYHVFVEPYGNAELYVAHRDAMGFDVVLRGGDPAVEFSYRVVAKRRGFEQQRLEPAPWADTAVQRAGEQ